jgi:DNA-binding CsgD family transcriptional regulator
MGSARHREGEWLDFVADLMATPLTWLPDEQVARLFATTFDALGCGFYSRVGADPPAQRQWPPQLFGPHLDEIRRWTAQDAPTQHPILRYYVATGDAHCMQVDDVPPRFADARVMAAWRERARRWGGVQAQAAVPLIAGAHAHRAFVIGRPNPFSSGDMELFRRLQRLLTGLDRQVMAFSRWSARNGAAASDVAADLRLSARELAVLELLAEGLTAASIGRRLAIAERTVQKHLQRCYLKLGVADRLAAVQRAKSIGLLLRAEARPPARLPEPAMRT